MAKRKGQARVTISGLKKAVDTLDARANIEQGGKIVSLLLTGVNMFRDEARRNIESRSKGGWKPHRVVFKTKKGASRDLGTVKPGDIKRAIIAHPDVKQKLAAVVRVDFYTAPHGWPQEFGFRKRGRKGKVEGKHFLGDAIKNRKSSVRKYIRDGLKALLAAQADTQVSE